jgi:peptidoglycan/LPS O-acetylase OafA/YrhL
MSPCNKPAYRPDIDGLRAVAVLAVVFYHAGLPGFSGGFVGVDVFFVISGYLITQIVWSDLENGKFSLSGFYLRRVKRIFPALFAMLAACSVAACFLLIPWDLEAYGKSLNATVLFVSNFHWHKIANYFDGPAIDKPLLHAWSLAVEEQFYVVWPLLLLLFKRFLKRKWLPYTILALAVVSLILAQARLPDHQKDAFYFPWCRGWELMLGSLLAILPVRLSKGPLANGLGVAGLVAIALAASLYDSSTVFPGLTALLPCIGAALVIAAGSVPNPSARLLSFEPIRRIGLISYSLYLIHWPIFSFAHLYFNRALPLALTSCIVAASLLLAYASWRYVETPFRTGRFPKPKAFGAAAAAMAGFCACGAMLIWSGGFASRASAGILALQDLMKDQETSPYCREIAIPGFKAGTACAIGEDRGGSYDFVLWGDSHARHYVPAVAALAANRKLSGLAFVYSGCLPFLNDTHLAALCRDLNASAARWLAANPVKVAILGGRWRNHIPDIHRFLKDARPSQNRGGLAQTLALLNSKGIQVSVLDQTPEFSQDVPRCIARDLFYGRDSEHCVAEPAASMLAWHSQLDDYFDFLRKDYSFTVASGSGAICSSGFCRARQDGMLLMVDNNHLSEAGALHSAPYLGIPVLNNSPDSGGDKPRPASTEASQAVHTPL